MIATGIKKLEQALKGEFVKNVFQLLTGTAGAQIVTIFALPVLSYYYDPEHFAVLAFFVATTSFIGVAIAGRFEFSLMLPKEEKESFDLLAISVCSALLFTALFTLILLAIGDIHFEYYKDIPINDFLLLLPLGTFLYSVNGIGEKWCARQKRFKKIAKAKIFYSLLMVSLQFALFRMAGIGLIVAYIAGTSLSIIVLFIEVWKDFRRIEYKLDFSRYNGLVKKYWRFPAYSVPSGLISQMAHQLPSFALPYFGASVLGNYSMGYKILNAPLGFLGSAISNVFFQRISTVRDRPEQANKMLKKAYFVLFLIILLPMIVLFFWGEPVIKMVLGDKWDNVGLYLKLLIPFLMLRFMVSPTALSMQAFERQNLVLIWMVCYLGASFLTFWWGINYSNAIYTILAYSLVSAFMYAIWINMSLKFKKTSA